MTAPAATAALVARDRSRELLGQVMGYVSITVAFTAAGAYLGRNLTGGAGLLMFIGAIGCIIGLNVATSRGREQLAIVLLFALGLLLGIAVAPVIAAYASSDPAALAGRGGDVAIRRRLRQLRLRDAPRSVVVGAHAVLGVARADCVR